MMTLKWALSSAGRASALQAGGHRFEPYSAHHFFYLYIIYGLVAQLVRALACHARGRGFEPLPGRHFVYKMVIFFTKISYAYLAQLVEQGTENPCVLGSIPRIGTKQKNMTKVMFFFVCVFILISCDLSQRGIEKERRLHEEKREQSARNSPVDYFVAMRVVF